MIAESRIAGLPKMLHIGSPPGEPPTLRQLAARQPPAEVRTRSPFAMNLGIAGSWRRDRGARRGVNSDLEIERPVTTVYISREL